jgi:hypothetical protein
MRNRMDERYDFVRAATDGRFHYLRNYTPHRVFQHGAYEWQSPAWQSWEREWRAGRLTEAQARFFAARRPFEELYDLQADRDSMTNLASEPAHAARLRAMRVGGGPGRGQCRRVHRPARRPHPVVRHWAAQGLLMLGAAAAPARERLAAMVRDDAVVQNQVVAAEAVATIAPSPDAVARLAAIVDGRDPWPVRLQALNALTFLGDQARAVLPTVKKAAASDQEYLRNAGRYLEAVLEGRYAPAYPVFTGAPPPRP